MTNVVPSRMSRSYAGSNNHRALRRMSATRSGPQWWPATESNAANAVNRILVTRNHGSRVSRRLALGSPEGLEPIRKSRTEQGVGDMADTHMGTCFCGAVEIEVSGAPLEMGYCHCSSCRSYSGGPLGAYILMTGHPGLGLTDVRAAVIPTVPFVPTVHRNYAEAVLPIQDGLRKLRDFPAEADGSGERMPEGVPRPAE